jgi:hypothetical protein
VLLVCDRAAQCLSRYNYHAPAAALVQHSLFVSPDPLEEATETWRRGAASGDSSSREPEVKQTLQLLGCANPSHSTLSNDRQK